MTQTAILFFSLCAAVSFLAGLVVVYPWIVGSKNTDNRLMAINVDSFQKRLAELQEDKQAGVIDDALYQTQVIELKRQLLAAQEMTPIALPTSKKSRLIVLLWIPILAAMAYVLSGDRTSVFTLWQGNDRVYQVADDLLTGKIDTPPTWATENSAALISAMQINVHHHANDPDRWMRLSELFMSLKANAQALEALARAYRLAPENEDIASTYAQVRFFGNEGNLDSTTRQVLQQLLTQNPKHEGAMMLMAMGETRAGNFAVAQQWVGRLRSLIAAKPGDHSTALQSLDKLSDTITDQAAKAKSGIQFDITVDRALWTQIQPQAVLFVSISDHQGGAPYAVKKIPVSQLVEGALHVTLGDMDAMMSERTISKAHQDGVQLIASARISQSGNAISQSGDLSANPMPLGKATKQISLTINQIIP